MICLSCTDSTIRADIELIENNRAYIDIVEIRVDFLRDTEFKMLASLPEQAALPCILTFRRPEDGGANPDIGTEQRCEILTSALDGGWAYLDIADDAAAVCEQQLVKTAEAAGTRVIKSFHDFSGVPENLACQMIDNSCGDRFVPKAAVMPNNTADLFKIVNAFVELERLKRSSDGYSCTNGAFLTDYILVGMGAVGFPSRIMAGAWGSMLTFSSAGETKAAPGYISPRELFEVYNYKNLTGATKVFGIVGNPVMHSRSPVLHNAALQVNGIDGVYLPFETAEPNLILENSEKINLHGLSVTIPHKQHVIEYAASVDPSVKAIGACNTLVYTEGWFGYNTDWKGFLAPLQNLLSKDEVLDGFSALVIGAGGAARAVIYALVSMGMKVTIVNRTADKALKLAEEFGCRGAGLEDVSSAGYKLVVQTTSAGMSPDIEGNPVPGFDFSDVEIAYDIIYEPELTCFLRNAEAAGCRIINGFPMLKAQAAEQFKLFTGFTME